MPYSTLGELSSRHRLVSISPETSLADACRILANKNIGALAVCVEGDLRGILSERDVISRAVALGRDPALVRAHEVMTADPVTIPAESAPAEALAEMRKHGIRHLVVTQGGRPSGMVSLRDIPTDDRIMWEGYEEYTAGRALPDTVQPYA